MSFYDRLLRFFGTSRARMRWRAEMGGGAPPRDLAASLPSASVVLIGVWALIYVLTLRGSYVYLDGTMPPQGSPATAVLIEYGASFGPFIMALDQWWRLVTGAFLHGSVPHILLNSLAFWSFGQVIEERFGTARMWVAFVLTAIAGNALSFAIRGFEHLTVGASGGVMGMVGVLGGYALRHRGGAWLEFKERIVPFLLFAVIIGFAVRSTDNAAHAGGLIAGVAFGALARQQSDARKLPRSLWIGLAAVCVAVVGASFLLAARTDEIAILRGLQVL